MACNFDLDENIVVVEQGEYHGMTGVIIARQAGTTSGLPGIFEGTRTCFYVVRFSNGKKKSFYELSIRRVE